MAHEHRERRRGAQIVELHSALEQIKDDSGRWNESLAMLK
jgi:hypothetical protein